MKEPETLSPNEFQHAVEDEISDLYPCPTDNFELRDAVHEQLRKLGFTRNGKGYVIEGQLTKQRIRDFHSKKRIEVLQNNKAFIEQYGRELVLNFATGREIDPEAITPDLIEVKPDSAESR
ncbi:MAG: hypothetical protein ABIJ57_07045, partial [Pseudomonadota bacterium]